MDGGAESEGSNACEVAAALAKKGIDKTLLNSTNWKDVLDNVVILL